MNLGHQTAGISLDNQIGIDFLTPLKNQHFEKRCTGCFDTLSPPSTSKLVIGTYQDYVFAGLINS